MNNDSVNDLQKLDTNLDNTLDAMLAPIMAVDEEAFPKSVRQMLKREIDAQSPSGTFWTSSDDALDDSIQTISEKRTFEKRMAEIKHGAETATYAASSAYHDAKLAWKLARNTYDDSKTAMQADLEYSDRMAMNGYKEEFSDDSKSGVFALIAKLQTNQIAGRNTRSVDTAAANTVLSEQASILIKAYTTFMDVTFEIELTRMENQAIAFKEYWQAVEAIFGTDD
uniref:hypothetical protein n=1 Tax=uncultured Erythrobacter sp. TaxID=263913 RepID=UPI00261BB05E|nr:hypothetical protein [uncultured Erythrobacter sp.]